MYLRVRKNLTYANVAMTLALVFAMTGGAYAAKHYLITSTKQISPKVLKALRGKAGPAGANGTNGAQGPAGPAGANGKDGAPGLNGKDGAPGLNGKDGKEGSPWTAGGKLPKGATETGTWANYHTAAVAGERPGSAISFNIPLTAGLDEKHVHYLKFGEKGEGKFEAGIEGKDGPRAGCPEESSVEEPAAEPGNLCIFAREEENAEPFFFHTGNPADGGAATAAATGAIVISVSMAPGEMKAFGTWAVTAP